MADLESTLSFTGNLAAKVSEMEKLCHQNIQAAQNSKSAFLIPVNTALAYRQMVGDFILHCLFTKLPKYRKEVDKENTKKTTLQMLLMSLVQLKHHALDVVG